MEEIKPSNTQLKTPTPISSQIHNINIKTLTIGSGESNPLPQDIGWSKMILTTQPQAFAHDHPLLLLLFFSCQNPLLSSMFLFWFCVHNGKKRKRKWFYSSCFLTSFQIPMLGFGMLGWKEKQGKCLDGMKMRKLVL